MRHHRSARTTATATAVGGHTATAAAHTAATATTMMTLRVSTAREDER